MSKEAMKMALEEMKICNYNSAAERLEAALAKQEQSEPVGEMQLSAIYEGMIVPVVPVELPVGTKLYTTPQQRTWVGLTEQEAAECWSTSTVRTWQAIEAKLKEKNT